MAEGSRLTENSATARRSIANRLAYSLDGQRPQSMTTLALFWPMPGLAALADPLPPAQAAAGPVDPAQLEQAIAAELSAGLPDGATSRAAGGEAWYWAAALQRPDSLPAAANHPDRILAALRGQPEPTDDEDGEDPVGLTAHIAHALHARTGDLQLPAAPPDLAATLAALAAHSPANIAWRALHRLVHDQPQVTPAGHWSAAAILASGLRSLFSRLETTLLLDRLHGDETYWRAVLRYSAGGNLQAVLDEYLHHLAVADADTILDDRVLAELAQAAAGAIASRPSRYQAFNPTTPDTPIAFTARFALRYGGRRQNQEDARQPEVRRAFNSPFWPFVLATTSVGQEGIDFHWWSHALLHWNTPANPVDFVQREGRVHRYAGHAIRRNIAHRHGPAILATTDGNPWQTAYQLAGDETARYGEFAPYWTYPGPARIQRHLAPYPLSIDTTRLAKLKQDIALYRLSSANHAKRTCSNYSAAAAPPNTPPDWTSCRSTSPHRNTPPQAGMTDPRVDHRRTRSCAGSAGHRPATASAAPIRSLASVAMRRGQPPADKRGGWSIRAAPYHHLPPHRVPDRPGMRSAIRIFFSSPSGAATAAARRSRGRRRPAAPAGRSTGRTRAARRPAAERPRPGHGRRS